MFLRKEKFGLLGFDPESKEVFVIEDEQLSDQLGEYCDIIENDVKSEAFLSAPVSLYVYPSMMCNKSCEFCYFRKQINSDALVMSDDVAENIITTCIKYGIFSVNILGGEPLLDKTSSISKLLIERLCSEQIAVNITTNGISLGKHADSLKQFKAVYGEYFNVNVSVNNDFGLNGAHKQVASSFSAIDNVGLKIGINTVVLSRDITDYQIIVDLINAQRTITGWYLLYPRVGGNKRWRISQYTETCLELESLIQNKKVNIEAPYAHKYNGTEIDSYPYTEFHYGCGMGKRTLSITPDGKVYGCSKLINNKDYFVGNIKDGLDRLWRNAYEIRQNTNLKLIPASCQTHCDYHSICEGCLADRIENVEAMCEFR